MYKLLIADDEILEREGLQFIINWNDIGIELVGCAENGQQALEMYHLYNPDIILTDIRMPFMDGLELTKKIRETDPAAIVILLSAYDEFKYAQKAIRIGVFDYVLKPIEVDNLADIILRAINLKVDNLKKAREAIPVLNQEDYKNFKADIYKNFIKLEEEVSRPIKRGDEISAINALDEIWIEFSQKNCSLDFIKRWGLQIIGILTKSIIDVGDNADVFLSKHDPLKQITDVMSVDDLYMIIKAMIIEACKYINENKRYKNKKLINAVLKMVQDNYNDKDISLNRIAETIYVSPSYLSALFKIEMGECFSDYLTMHRIEKAKELLKNVKYKIYDISDLVGYSDSHYFSKIFKIVTGMTPKEFRNLTE